MDWITAIKEIQKAQEDDRLVVFVGAGVSKNSGVPPESLKTQVYLHGGI